MKDFIRNFLKDVDIDGGNIKVGVNVFSSGSKIEFHLNEYETKADLFAAIDSVSYQGYKTNIARALERTRLEMFTVKNGDRPDVDNMIVLLTDGKSSKLKERAVPEAEETRDAGIHIYGVAIGFTDYSELDQIVTKPASSNRFAVDSFDELNELKRKIFAEFCGKLQTHC